jgi:hypothetical protein
MQSTKLQSDSRHSQISQPFSSALKPATQNISHITGLQLSIGGTSVPEVEVARVEKRSVSVSEVEVAIVESSSVKVVLACVEVEGVEVWQISCPQPIKQPQSSYSRS